MKTQLSASELCVALASIEGVTLADDTPEDAPEFPYLLYENGGYSAYVGRMLYNWRIAERGPLGFLTGRYWCYAGNGIDTFARVVRVLDMWGADPDREPAGWIKSHAWPARPSGR